MLGIGTCGILQRVNHVQDLSHSLVSVRFRTEAASSILFEYDCEVIQPASSKDHFEPIVAKVVDGAYRISQNEFELNARIPHYSCLVHRVQKRALQQSCAIHTTPIYIFSWHKVYEQIPSRYGNMRLVDAITFLAYESSKGKALSF